MSDIEHVTEIIEQAPEPELVRRYRWSRLQIDLSTAEARFVAAAESLIAHLEQMGLQNLSVGTRIRLRAALNAQEKRDAASRALASLATEPKCGAV